jgi:hypothetical protein
MIKQSAKRLKWLYPAMYSFSVIVSLLPLYTEKTYAPRDTQKVLIDLFTVVTTPYRALAPIFHISTLVFVVLISLQRFDLGRFLAGYMGANYLLLSIIQTIGKTLRYGLVVHTGGMVLYIVLGITWIIMAVRNDLRTTFDRSAWPHMILLPLVLLAFWAPYSISDNVIRPDFRPILLMISPDYGLTFCFTTPVFLFFMILFFPNISTFGFRMTAFNGLLYGILNLAHWFNPTTRWMGFLHLPLLVISIYSIVLSTVVKDGQRTNNSAYH